MAMLSVVLYAQNISSWLFSAHLKSPNIFAIILRFILWLIIGGATINFGFFARSKVLQSTPPEWDICIETSCVFVVMWQSWIITFQLFSTSNLLSRLKCLLPSRYPGWIKTVFIYSSMLIGQWSEPSWLGWISAVFTLSFKLSETKK